MKKVISVVVLFLVLSVISVSASSMMWSQTYGGDGMDVCTSMVQTDDDGFALLGSAFSFGDGVAWLVKTDADGNMQWNKTAAGAPFIQTLDGGFAFVGTNSSYIGEYIPVGYLPDGFWSYVWLGKTDADGNMEWSQTFDEEVGCYQGSSLVQTKDGGYALLGNSFSSVGDYDDVLLIKTDSYGNKEWSRLYNYSEQESGSGLIQTLDEGFAFIHKTYSSLGGVTGFVVIKTDAAGNVKWNQSYPDSNMAGVSSFAQLSNGGFVLAGITYSSGEGGADFYLTKLDENGNVEWSQTYGTQYREFHPSAVQTSDGGFALAGYMVTNDENIFADFLLIKTDNQGNMQWNQTYAGGEVLGYPSLVQTSDGGFALSGAIKSWETGAYDYWLIKTEPHEEPHDNPEVLLWLILPVTLAAVVAVPVVYRRRLHKQNQSGVKQ
ncbi:MAG: hypothetical protein PVH73_00895 [Candidatus Bathyarchaeota archaeon]|jgi:hypothetical protein